jgi:hypothetical protein
MPMAAGRCAERIEARRRDAAHAIPPFSTTDRIVVDSRGSEFGLERLQIGAGGFSVRGQWFPWGLRPLLIVVIIKVRSYPRVRSLGIASRPRRNDSRRNSSEGEST